MGPLEWLADKATDAMIVAFNFATSHMSVSGALCLAVGVGYATATTLRVLWPHRSRRPGWVRVGLAVTSPFAEALIGVLSRLGRREAAPPARYAPRKRRP